MTKADLQEKLQEIIGAEKVSKAECGRILDAFLETIEETVKAGEEMKMGNLFKIYKKDVKAKEVRNPKTGEKRLKPAHSVLAVKVLTAGKTLFGKVATVPLKK